MGHGIALFREENMVNQFFSLTFDPAGSHFKHHIFKEIMEIIPPLWRLPTA